MLDTEELRKRIGTLANNGTQVMSLQTSLSRSQGNVDLVPLLIGDMIEENTWREYIFPGHPEQVYAWDAKDFRRFIESPRKQGGCETPLHVVERMLKGTTAWEPFCLLIGGERGGTNNPHGANQHSESSEVNSDNVTIDLPVPPPPRGNTTTYAVRRLSRDRPDLLEKVKAGEVSPHAAMVEAGFKEKQITVPADPRKAARRLARHFSREQFSDLVDEMLRYYEAQRLQ